MADSLEPSSSGLRYRGVPGADSSATSPDAFPAAATLGSNDGNSQRDSLSDVGTSTAFDSELALARRARAEKVKQQMEQDGWDYVSDEAVGEGSRDGARRASDVTASSRDGDEDDDAEVARRMLGSSRQGGQDDLPDVGAGEFDGHAPGDKLPTARDVQDETPVTRDDQPPPQRDQAPPEVPLPPPEGDEKMCRICFDGEDEELGRLFSPCQCRGTSRYVHVQCLDAWRAASAGHTSHYKCDQCHYEYKLHRTKIAGLASNRFTLGAATVLTFALLIFLAGFVATWIIDLVEARAARLALNPSVFEDIFVSDYVIMGEGVREAVEFFGNTVQKTGIKALQSPDAYDDDDLEGGFSGVRGWFASLGRKARGQPRKPSLLQRTVAHFIKGFSLVGITSFFQMFIATAVFGPLGLRGSLFRAVRPGRRRNGDNQTSIGQLVIVMFVLVGAAKAVQQVYRSVRWISKRALKGVEGLVMEV